MPCVSKTLENQLNQTTKGSYQPEEVPGTLSLSLFHTHTYTHLISLQFIIISISRVIILSIYSGKIRNNI